MQERFRRYGVTTYRPDRCDDSPAQVLANCSGRKRPEPRWPLVYHSRNGILRGSAARCGINEFSPYRSTTCSPR